MFKFLWNSGAALFWLFVIGGAGIWLPLTLWWSGGCASEEFERVAVTSFDFNHLLSFKSTQRVGDLVEADIRPGLVSQ